MTTRSSIVLSIIAKNISRITALSFAFFGKIDFSRFTIGKIY